MNAVQKCLNELHLGFRELYALRTAIMSNSEPSRNGKCLASCAMQKTSLINNGNISQDAVKELDPSLISADFQQCLNVTGSDKCEKDYNIIQCCYQQYTTTKMKLKSLQ